MTNYKENYKFTSRHEDEKGDWTSDDMVVRLKKCNVRGKEILANQRDFPHEEPRYNCTRQKAQKIILPTGKPCRNNTILCRERNR
jgi:hypothetical protein